MKTAKSGRSQKQEDSALTSAAEVNCRQCKSLVSWYDQYCGVCGTPLAHPRWKTQDGQWRSGDDRLAIRGETSSIRILFGNDGIVPAALVLRGADLQELPNWIEGDTFGEQVLTLLPGEHQEVPLEVPLASSRLERLIRPGEEDSHDLPPSLEATLPFLTNRVELRSGQWTNHPFALTLVVARQPWISPRASLYRFIPWERLDRERLSHSIELHNQAVQDLLVMDVTLADDFSATPPACAPILMEDLFRSDPLDEPVRVEPRKHWDKEFIFAAGPPDGERDLGWFSGFVVYKLQIGDEKQEIRARIQGYVGRAPSLEVEGIPEWNVELSETDQEQVFVVRNPGHLPVAVAGVDVYRGGGSEVISSAQDWLIINGLAVGDVIPPGDSRALRLTIDERQRPREEYTEEVCRRRLVLRHDGWTPQGSSWAEIKVYAPFGKIKEVSVGIDFGTSNSTVCLWGTDYPHLLMLEDHPELVPTLASLMYFNESGSSDETFLFGEAAHGSAGRNPTHLVRSIKTVVAQHPETPYFFLQSTPNGSRRRVVKTAQNLLTIFLRELKNRGERALVNLKFDELSDLGLRERRIIFRRAVFSHPVDMTPETRHALMAAVQESGINTHLQNLDLFFRESCIDEATAAALAYVYARRRGLPRVSQKPLDRERLICFDVGGGTTDVAALEIHNLATHIEKGGKIVVDLMAKEGDSRFGGDNMDVVVANIILQQVLATSEEQGAPILTDLLQRAIESRSFAEFFDNRTKTIISSVTTTLGSGDIDDTALRVYYKAVEILREAERIKRRLSEEVEVVRNLSGTEWPRISGSREATGAENFEVRITRAEFESVIEKKMETRLRLISSVIEGIGWDWASITTLLFTGQAVRTPVVRRQVKEFIESRRGSGAVPPLVAIEPEDGNDFDPKNCVAIGAALWGRSRSGSTWIEINRSGLERLTFNIEREEGWSFRPVPGLEKGKTFPVEAEISFDHPQEELLLYRDHRRFVQFAFPVVEQVVVQVRSPEDIWVIADGQPYQGEVLS